MTRYERRRNQRSRIWRKRRARQKENRTVHNRLTRNEPRVKGPNLPPKQESVLLNWVRQSMMMAKMKAANAARANDTEQTPQKVMQRRGV